MKNYGNTFGHGREDFVAGKIPLWVSTDEFYPAGCTLNQQTAGTTIKAGTAVLVSKMGGEATVYGSNAAPAEGEDALEVTGLLLEDVYIGTDGATGTIVTKGSVLADRIPELSDAVKAAIAGRITLVHE